MKKLLVVLFVLMLVATVAFIGCEKKEAPAPAEQPAMTPAPAPAPVPAPAPAPAPKKPAKK